MVPCGLQGAQSNNVLLDVAYVYIKKTVPVFCLIRCMYMCLAWGVLQAECRIYRLLWCFVGSGGVSYTLYVHVCCMGTPGPLDPWTLWAPVGP